MSAAEDLMAKLTGGQKGGGTIGKFMIDENFDVQPSTADYMGVEYNTRAEAEAEAAAAAAAAEAAAEAAAKAKAGGRRRRHSKGHKSNSWLAHVKATMKLHPGKSFKQVLKIAKKTYKRSQSQSSSQSQSGGRKSKRHNRRKGNTTRQNQQNQQNQQNGGSGGKVDGVGASASPYV